MVEIFLQELKAKRSALLRQLGRVKPFVEGSLAEIHSECGTKNCRCHQGQKHRSVRLCRKETGKSQAIYVPRDLEEEVRQWNEEHKRIKALLKEISLLSEQIIRGYVKNQRSGLKPKDLKVLRGGRKRS
ncbi:MAG: DUF6788 family protein [Planctomycetota bacterium]